jgi:predicted permease
MRDLMRDLQQGLRGFRHQPGFAIVAVLVLGLGIGANTTIFSLVNTLVLKPRPGAGDQLVSIYSKDRTEPDTFRSFSYDNFSDLRARTEIFASLSAHNPALVGITEGEATRRTFIDITTADLFDTFQVPLLMGRTFTREEERPGADIPVTILSYIGWSRMGSPADIIGRSIRINQRYFTIVGLAPEGFTGTTTLVSPELWVPTGVYQSVVNDFADNRSSSLSDRKHHALSVFGRLREGVTMESAAPMLAAAGSAMEAAYPDANKNQDLISGPLSRFSVNTNPTNDAPIAILATSLMAMAGIVLLVASLNLANMQLARAGARRKEFAIRLAIGGSRFRLVRQLITEGLMLSFAGGLIAMFMAWMSMRAIISGMSGLLPILMNLDATPDWRIFVATMVFAVAGTLMSSLGPALSSARTDILPELKENAGEMKVSRRPRFATRNLLVMGQLALSLALLTTAGAFIRAAVMAASVDPGFSFDRGIHANFDTSLASYTEPRAMALYAQVIERIRQMPGVTAAGLATQIPFGEFNEAARVQKAGKVIGPAEPSHESETVITTTVGISPDYFEALGLSMRRGRTFTDAEWSSLSPGGGRQVGIIDESLSTFLFGAEDPIGRLVQINHAAPEAPEVIEVIGIAPPIMHAMEDKKPLQHLYRPYAQNFRASAYLHLRTSVNDEAAMLPALRSFIRDIDAQLPVITLETGPMLRERNALLWIIRTGATLFAMFGGIALFMAALGIYGVKAYLVARRTREIGIRVALGATTRDVLSLVIRDGLTLTAVGLVIGLALSAVAVRGIGGFLFGGGGFDLPIVAAAFITLAAASVAATLIPARKATRIAPTIALRAE